jgi:hypothetical protein
MTRASQDGPEPLNSPDGVPEGPLRDTRDHRPQSYVQPAVREPVPAACAGTWRVSHTNTATLTIGSAERR